MPSKPNPYNTERTRLRPAHFLPEQFTQIAESVRSGADLPGLNTLVRQADELLHNPVASIMDKEKPGPTGSKHDYLSHSIYHWPNPDTEDGFPYITKDGQVNPDSEQYDRPPFASMVMSVDNLSIAYALTGREAYAQKAVEIIQTWFINEDTLMNPNMDCAQWIPGYPPFNAYRPPRPVEGPGGKYYIAYGGLIEGHILPVLTQSIPLLASSSYMNEDMLSAVKKWFAGFLEWVLNSQAGRDEAACPNNHATWYCVQAASYAQFTGRKEIIRSLLTDKLPGLMKEHIRPDGSQPIEFKRAIGLTYTYFNLEALFSCAVIGQEEGIDIWNLEPAEGASIRNALDWTLPFILEKEQWPYNQIKPFETPRAGALLSMAYTVYGDEKYRQALNQLPGYPEDHPCRVIYPVRLGSADVC